MNENHNFAPRENPLVNNSSSQHFLPHKHLCREFLHVSVCLCAHLNKLLLKALESRWPFPYWVILLDCRAGWKLWRQQQRWKRPADLHTKDYQLEEPWGLPSDTKQPPKTHQWSFLESEEVSESCPVCFSLCACESSTINLQRIPPNVQSVFRFFRIINLN